MKDRRFDLTAVSVMGIFALFLAGLLLLTVYGARVYGETVDARTSHGEKRALISYVSVAVSNHDESGALSLKKGPESDMMILSSEENGSAFETRIYVSNGALVEEYARAGDELGSGSVQSVGACSSFTVKRVGENSIRVCVDGDNVLLHLRSGQEVTA